MPWPQTGPGHAGIALGAGDDMDMQLAHDVAERAGLILVQPVDPLQRLRRPCWSRRSASPGRAASGRGFPRCRALRHQHQPRPAAVVHERAVRTAPATSRLAVGFEPWSSANPALAAGSMGCFLSVSIRLERRALRLQANQLHCRGRRPALPISRCPCIRVLELPIWDRGRLVVDEPLANRVRSGRKQP